MSFSFSRLLLLFVLFFSLGCQNKKEDKTKEWMKPLALAVLGLNSTADNYSRIFYLDPLYLTSKNYELFPRATAAHVNASRKKLVIVHGWQSKDRDNNANPSEQELKARIVETIWSDVFKSEFLGQVIAKGYDIYFYTYLTSNRIDTNSNRFRSAMDSLFSGQPKNLVIYAHSMGGLLTKSSIYLGEEPSYLSRVLTVGAPYHGSPWASSAFQSNKTILGDLASYMTDTEGGKQLAWDNFDNSLSGASNPFLDELNKNTSRNHLFYAYYGSLNKNASGYSGSEPLLLPGCLALDDKFSNSDCIVPVTSATGTNLSFTKVTNLGALNHTDINLRTQSIRNQILLDLE